MKKEIRNILKSTLFCWKSILKYSRLWSLLLIIAALISSFSILIHAKVLERMINSLSNGTLSAEVYQLIALWAVSVFAMNLFSLLNKYMNIHINAEMEKNFLPVVIDKYRNLAYYEFESKDTQDLFQHVTSSSYKTIVSMLNISINTVASVITIVEAVYIFAHAVWLLGIIAIVITIPLVYFKLKSAYIEMKQRWTMTKDIRKRYYFQSLFADKNSLQEIKVFDSKDYFIDESEKLTQAINKDLKTNIGKVTRLKLCFAITTCIFTILVVGMSSRMMITHQLQLGTFVILINSISIFVGAEQRLSDHISEIARTSESVHLILQFLNLDEIDDAVSPETFRPSNGTQKAPAIEFEHVFFSDPNSSNVVLKDLSFTVEQGEIVSFVGVNGSGKSTMIKLICGLYQPDSGTIRINGMDTSKMSSEQIGKELSAVFQDGQHYMLSLRENIGLGNIANMQNDDLLLQALQSAGVRDVFQLENGLDQNLGTIRDDAIDLSGGQWQRVLIARAFAGAANIILFDEPTSSLDPIAECELYNTIHDSLLKVKKTSILISHRLASCVFSDKIMVIKDGCIHESGSHSELMARHGYYAEMFSKQQSWYQ